MSEEQERYFERVVPLRSVLGREFLTLQAERNKHKQAFESSPVKMSLNTLAYRRSEIALGRFLDDFTPRVTKALRDMEDGKWRLAIQEEKAKKDLAFDRSDYRKMWRAFAVSQYREHAKPFRSIIKKYHPVLWRELLSQWRTFRVELSRWMYGTQPFDGSQAMSEMIAFQVRCRLVGAHND